MLNGGALKKIEYLLKEYGSQDVTVNILEEHLITTLAIEIDQLNKKVNELNIMINTTTVSPSSIIPPN